MSNKTLLALTLALPGRRGPPCMESSLSFSSEEASTSPFFASLPEHTPLLPQSFPTQIHLLLTPPQSGELDGMLSPLDRREKQDLEKGRWQGQNLGPDSHCRAPSRSFNCRPCESLHKGRVPMLTKASTRCPAALPSRSTRP